jgi:hypothetical protein
MSLDRTNVTREFDMSSMPEFSLLSFSSQDALSQRFLFFSLFTGAGARKYPPFGMLWPPAPVAARDIGGTEPSGSMKPSSPRLTGTPIWRPYLPLRPLPSSSLTQPSMPMPASLQRPQGRWRSQPFLLLRQRWQRGLEERSSSSVPRACWKLMVDAAEVLRDCEGSEAGDIGTLACVWE